MALRPYSRQAQLWGPSPDAVLPADHLARVIDELIESLAVARLNRRYEHTPGELAFDVRLLCKVLIYAYARGITSSRQMARECDDQATPDAARFTVACQRCMIGATGSPEGVAIRSGTTRSWSACRDGAAGESGAG